MLALVDDSLEAVGRLERLLCSSVRLVDYLRLSDLFFDLLRGCNRALLHLFFLLDTLYWSFGNRFGSHRLRFGRLFNLGDLFDFLNGSRLFVLRLDSLLLFFRFLFVLFGMELRFFSCILVHNLGNDFILDSLCWSNRRLAFGMLFTGFKNVTHFCTRCSADFLPYQGVFARAKYLSVHINGLNELLTQRRIFNYRCNHRLETAWHLKLRLKSKVSSHNVIEAFGKEGLVKSDVLELLEEED